MHISPHSSAALCCIYDDGRHAVMSQTVVTQFPTETNSWAVDVANEAMLTSTRAVKPSHWALVDALRVRMLPGCLILRNDPPLHQHHHLILFLPSTCCKLHPLLRVVSSWPTYSWVHAVLYLHKLQIAVISVLPMMHRVTLGHCV